MTVIVDDIILVIHVTGTRIHSKDVEMCLRTGELQLLRMQLNFHPQIVKCLITIDHAWARLPSLDNYIHGQLLLNCLCVNTSVTILVTISVQV